MKFFFFLLLIPALLSAQLSKPDLLNLSARAKNVTIIRDTWGIPHIYGKSDADAVFGLLYAQCEDDFRRVEMNTLEMLGRTAEVYGEKNLAADLQMRLIYDTSAAISDYKTSPPWFRKLLDASADGVNYYLLRHPYVKPFLLTHFEPWYSLMRTDGSISATSTGGVTLADIKDFYLGRDVAFENPDIIIGEDLSGSNGFALAPSKTVSHNAMLYINPHVTFYFRQEVHIVSEEGLNAYGAVTWGQFFVYQGFNAHCGWMHTSSHADVADLYREEIVKNKDGIFYRYNGSLRPVSSKFIELYFKRCEAIVRRTVTTYSTHHGPVISGKGGQWLAVKEYNRSLKALMQSWLRTKANNYAQFEATMNMRGNTTNNTVYADDSGNIAYWHGDFMPKRDPSYNWSLPVDGTTSKTEWKGIHDLKEIVQIHNPSTGWIQNCNSTPFTVSGIASPDKNNYPLYMAPDGQNPRALNAMHLLGEQNRFTLNSLIAAGYSTYLSAFDLLLPALFNACDSNAEVLTDSIRNAIVLLKAWDKKSSTESIATTLAIEWASLMMKKVPVANTDEERSNTIGHLQSASHLPSSIQVKLFIEMLDNLVLRFGTWKVEWGNMNLYQRINYDLGEKFDDSKLAMKVGMASSAWGCIPAFNSVVPEGSKYHYGISGNSFVAAVEFGKKVTAKSIVTGGEGTNSLSKHFLDQANGYIHGEFKDIWFYKEDVMKHVDRSYHPGLEKK